MSQHDYDIANGSGAAVRADINSLNSAMASLNSGASAPSTTFAYMLWADTTTGLMKQRNAANSAWVTLWTIATGPAAQFLPLTGGTLSGNLTIANTNAFEPQVTLYNQNNGSSGPYYVFKKGRGAGVAAQVGDAVGTVLWQAYDSTGTPVLQNSASIAAILEAVSAGTARASVGIIAGPNTTTFSSGTGGPITIPGQIAFPASQVASAGANVFDDYEEGSYTPSWSGNGTPPAVGNGVLGGRYVKLGIFVWAIVTLSAGTTTTFGTGFWTFTTPLTMSNGDEISGCSGYALDASAGARYQLFAVANTSSAFVASYTPNLVGLSVPFTWANTDTCTYNLNMKAST